jgi:hypothetical protein
MSQSPVWAIARADAANSGGVSSTSPVLPNRHTNSSSPQTSTVSSTSGHTNLRDTRASCVRLELIAYTCKA